jgi:hypothetical protein
MDVLAAGGQPLQRRFLVDCAADRTVFSAALLQDLQLPEQPPPPGLSFQGIGGASAFVIVSTVLELMRDSGGTARVRGQFAAFTDPRATDMSILGRDVLDHFDVIVSRRRNEGLLLAPNHHYTVAVL